MNLLQIRQHVMKKSGRHDLATTRNVGDTTHIWDVDNGADFYIQSGSRALDLAQDIPEQFFDVGFAIGDYIADLRDCRQVSRVTVIDSDGVERTLNAKSSFSNLVDAYTILAATGVGPPEDWAIYPRVRPPKQKFLGAKDDIHSVILMPPTDETLTIRVYGQYFSSLLEENEDENYWSIKFPELLIMAAIREIEVYNRNTQGYNDMTLVINERLMGVNRDLEKDELEMEG